MNFGNDGYKFIDCYKYTTLMWMLIMKYTMRVCGKRVCGNSILPAQFCCDPKTDLKNEVSLKRETP